MVSPEVNPTNETIIVHEDVMTTALEVNFQEQRLLHAKAIASQTVCQIIGNTGGRIWSEHIAFGHTGFYNIFSYFMVKHGVSNMNNWKNSYAEANGYGLPLTIFLKADFIEKS